MRIAVTGSSGMVGSALTSRCHDQGHQCVGISRGSSGAEEVILWSPSEGTIQSDELEGFDAVVHLAGENVGEGRWTAAKKRKIHDSRVDGTELLCETLASRTSPPKTLVSASAIGYYGDRGDEVCDENSSPGSDFLAEVCVAWEAATSAASETGIRVVNLRIGVVLSTRGGALAKMLTPFKLGVGGKVGGGEQYMSWITLDDVVGAIVHCLEHDELAGPVNAVAPGPVTNAEFTRQLGKTLGRPTVFPMPAFAARLAFGEMADALLLSSTRVSSEKLRSSGFSFRHESLDQALDDLLRKPS